MEIAKTIYYKVLRIIRPSLFKTQSFTYYIPAPPKRKSGYREKEFDKVFYHFINLGFDLISYKTVSHSGDDQSGFWVVFLVRANHPKASKLNLNDEYDRDNFSNETEVQLNLNSDNNISLDITEE